MDKWQKRAAERRRQREKQLRRRLMIGGGAAAAVVLFAVVIPIAFRGSSGKANLSSSSVSSAQSTEVSAGTNVASGTGETTDAENIAAEGTAGTGTTGGDTTGTAASGTGAAAAGVTGTDGQVTDPAAAADSTQTDPAAAATTDPAQADQAANAADPRADFAVDPARTDWNYDQDGDKVVYLTFDDGPSYLTMQFLDMLDACDVKATFFVTSQAPQYADCIQEAYRRGHTIGLHTSSHSFEIYKSVEDYFSDLEQIGNVVRDQIGYVPAFIRFPGGSSNTRSSRYATGIMATLTQEVVKRGYQYWDWNAETGDGSMVSVDEEIAEATSCEYNNIVMLAHDGDLKEATLEAMPTIIQNFKDRGYTFKALDRQAKVIHHEVMN